MASVNVRKILILSNNGLKVFALFSICWIWLSLEKSAVIAANGVTSSRADDFTRNASSPELRRLASNCLVVCTSGLATPSFCKHSSDW
ncbi:hypothetical protein EV401DRAFT_358008 [Pisolithus croceorrhizus]|nr:hypothetical protein EV401DRAFT_358008 [Pisolithus croceorrhizus]